ncbi:MAG: enoyl-CoA hydratase-related protein, partial [Acidimicrobiia bacterium]|nr:enoyl-CoA hydratase-related protein [Acidimicrobiia bacterium]
MTGLPDVFELERRPDGIAVLWLSRPEKLNAMGPPFWEGLPEAMHLIGGDDAVRVVILAGRGRAVSVGLDLPAFSEQLMGSGEVSPAAKSLQFLQLVKSMQGAITSVADCPKPVIAAVHGYCLGGGVDLITACDMRLAAADAVFSVRETRLAMVADVGTLQRLPAIVGPGRVADLVYSGRDVSASEALDYGLVEKVYPDAETLLKEALELANRIAANSPLAVQGAKAVLRAGANRSVD